MFHLNLTHKFDLQIAEAPAQVITVTFEGMVAVNVQEATLKAVRNDVYKPFRILAAVFMATSIDQKKPAFCH